jgi:ABC-type Mn2+/Zn2+ transport system permease subunit
MSMLTLPPLLAGLFCTRLSMMIASSIGLSMIYMVNGLYVAYLLNWPVGATIALSAIFFYGVGQLFHRKRAKPLIVT